MSRPTTRLLRVLSFARVNRRDFVAAPPPSRRLWLLFGGFGPCFLASDVSRLLPRAVA